MLGFLVVLLPDNWNQYLADILRRRLAKWKQEKQMKQNGSRVQDTTTAQLSRLRTPSGRVKWSMYQNLKFQSTTTLVVINVRNMMFVKKSHSWYNKPLVISSNNQSIDLIRVIFVQWYIKKILIQLLLLKHFTSHSQSKIRLTEVWIHLCNEILVWIQQKTCYIILWKQRTSQMLVNQSEVWF